MLSMMHVAGWRLQVDPENNLKPCTLEVHPIGVKHIHRVIKKETRDYGWCYCVTPAECAAKPLRQNAHGNIVRIDFCRCGAIRESEVNGNAINRGEWINK